MTEDAKPKWTPGPWTAQEISPDDPEWGAFEVFATEAEGWVATHVCGGCNASLIAAAPELCDALETTRRALQMAMIDLCKMAAEKQEIYRSPLMEVAMENSSAALRKARGE